MGILDEVLGSVLGGRSGGMQDNRGGFGGGMQGGSSQGGMSPILMALMALLSQQSGSGGGLGGLLGGLTGQTSSGDRDQVGRSGQFQRDSDLEPAGRNDDVPSTGEWSGGHTGGLGGLLERLEQNGHGSKAKSWVGHGQNETISPHELNDALGSDTVGQLSRQTGMSKDELLEQLSQVLPQAVDKLTPQGRVPEQHEMQNW